MATFIRDAGNYVLHFIFMYVLIATGLAMVLMFLFLAIGLTIQTVFGIKEISTSPIILGGIGVGISVAFIVAGIIAVWGTIKVAPSEKNRDRFFSKTSKTLGRPTLPSDLGYTEAGEDDDDEADWWVRARDRKKGDEDYSVLG